MIVKRMDFAPFLKEGERVEYKTVATAGVSLYVEAALCFLLWIVTLAGDCFVVGAAYALKEQIKIELYYLIIFGVLTAIHFVPFAFWLISILRKFVKRTDRWYAITQGRLITVSGTKPVEVNYVNLNDVTSFGVKKHAIILYLGEERVVLSGIENESAFAGKLEHALDSIEESAPAYGQLELTELDGTEDEGETTTVGEAIANSFDENSEN